MLVLLPESRRVRVRVRLASPLLVKLAETLIRLNMVMMNTGRILDTFEFRELVLHTFMDSFYFCVRREPSFHYGVITLHRSRRISLVV